MTGLGALGELDAWTVLMVLSAAVLYGSSLFAAGSALFAAVFSDCPPSVRRTLNRGLLASAWVAILTVLLRWPLQAGFLGGGSWAAAVDPMLLGIVLESAAGTRMVMSLGGLLLVQAIAFERGRLRQAGKVLALVGAVLVLLSFSQVGHTRADPRWLLGGLLVTHLATVAFWIGAFLPLYRLAAFPADDPTPGRILSRFGRVAMVAVGLLVLSGLLLAWWLVRGLSPLLTTAYGQWLLAKVSLVCLLLGFAAWNKWRLVPSLERGTANARGRLRGSILAEISLVGGILLVTAVFTTLTAPGT
jgi:putative copper resistance protein D